MKIKENLIIIILLSSIIVVLSLILISINNNKDVGRYEMYDDGNTDDANLKEVTS